MASFPINRADTDPSSPAWQKYYADASRRRRANRKFLPRSPSEDRKRRQRIETVALAVSVVFLCALMAIFHAVLTR